MPNFNYTNPYLTLDEKDILTNPIDNPDLKVKETIDATDNFNKSFPNADKLQSINSPESLVVASLNNVDPYDNAEGIVRDSVSNAANRLSPQGSLGYDANKATLYDYLSRKKNNDIIGYGNLLGSGADETAYTKSMDLSDRLNKSAFDRTLGAQAELENKSLKDVKSLSGLNDLQDQLQNSALMKDPNSAISQVYRQYISQMLPNLKIPDNASVFNLNSIMPIAANQIKNQLMQIDAASKVAGIAKTQAETKKTMAEAYGPGQRTQDTEYAKEFNDWSNDKVEAAKNIAKIQEVAQSLANEKNLIGTTGTVAGYLSNTNPTIRDVLLPSTKKALNDVREAIQTGLKQVYGGNPSDREGINFIASKFDPALDTSVNASNLNKLAVVLQQKAIDNENKAKYFEQNKTLNGYTSSAPSLNELVNQFGGNKTSSNNSKIKVMKPSGDVGFIDSSYLDKALAKGWKKVD